MLLSPSLSLSLLSLSLSSLLSVSAIISWHYDSRCKRQRFRWRFPSQSSALTRRLPSGYPPNTNKTIVVSNTRSWLGHQGADRNPPTSRFKPNGARTLCATMTLKGSKGCRNGYMCVTCLHITFIQCICVCADPMTNVHVCMQFKHNCAWCMDNGIMVFVVALICPHYTIAAICFSLCFISPTVSLELDDDHHLQYPSLLARWKHLGIET